MKKVTVYFVGGTNVTFSKCDKECVENIEKFLVDDNLKLFKVNGVNERKETILRKDLILFVDID